ncbi:GNAT family N-acetyltransferase [Staphylococcus simulans]
MSDVQLVPYDTQYNHELEQFTIAEKEKAFALLPLAALEDLAPGEYPVVVLYQQHAVGFMRLNHNDEGSSLAQNPNAVLVKSFSITEHMQGQGLAQAALAQLPDYVETHFPNTDEIVLSVNFKNPKAIHVYQKLGYIDTKRVLEGPAGPQHVMSYHL